MLTVLFRHSTHGRTVIGIGTIWNSYQSYCTAFRRGYRNMSWCSTIWPCSTSARIQRHSPSVIHYEGASRRFSPRPLIFTRVLNRKLQKRAGADVNFGNCNGYARCATSQVKLPADQEDWQKRPAYIKENNAGVYICENRYVLDYAQISPGYRHSSSKFSCILPPSHVCTGCSILSRRELYFGKGEP